MKPAWENVFAGVAALGNEQDNHTIHWHGQTVLDHGRRTDVIEVLPASMASVDMVPRSPGSWLLHCHVNDHMTAGMSRAGTYYHKSNAVFVCNILRNTKLRTASS